MHNKQTLASLVGIISIFFWSATGIMMCFLRDLPHTQVLLLTQGLGAISMLVWTTARGGWRALFTRWKTSIVLGLLFGLNQLAYMAAYRYASPEQLELIAYLWPLMVVAGGSVMLGDRLSVAATVGIGVAFGGVALLVLPQLVSQGVSFAYLPGYLLALVAALAWTAYSLIARRKQVQLSETLGLQLIAPSLFALALQLNSSDGWLSPSYGQWTLLVVYGVCVNGVGVALWGWAMRSGRLQLLGTLAYATPVLTVIWLVVFGMAPASWELAIASVCVVTGCLLARSSSTEKIAEEEATEELAEAA